MVRDPGAGRLRSCAYEGPAIAGIHVTGVRRRSRAAVVVTFTLRWSVIVAAPLVSAATPHGDDCACPESSPEWVVFPDTARGAPDFFQKSSIEVEEVLFCERGVHLFCRARQAGDMRDVCLVIGEPTLEFNLRSLPADSLPSEADLAVIGEQLERDQRDFGKRTARLRSLLHCPADGNHVAQFKGGWFSTAPKILLGPPLLLQRGGGLAIALVGIVDVYFRTLPP